MPSVSPLFALPAFLRFVARSCVHALMALAKAHACATSLIAEAKSACAAAASLSEELAATRSKLRAATAKAAAQATEAERFRQASEASLINLQIELEASARQLALAKGAAQAAKADANAVLTARDKASEASLERIYELEARVQHLEAEHEQQAARAKAKHSLELEALRAVLQQLEETLTQQDTKLQAAYGHGDALAACSAEVDELRRKLAETEAALARAGAAGIQQRSGGIAGHDSDTEAKAAHDAEVAALRQSLFDATAEQARIKQAKAEQDERLVQMAALLRESNDRCAALLTKGECGTSTKRKRVPVSEPAGDDAAC